MVMEKKLYRNQHDKFIAGVSSGLADYMQVEVTIIRLLFVLSTVFLAGTGLLVYIVLWVVAPVNNDPAARFKKFNDLFQKNDAMFNSPNAFGNPSTPGDQTKWNTPNVGPDFKMPKEPNFDQMKKNNETSRTIGGLVLLVIGLFLLMKYTFDIVPHWFSIWKLWPVAIIAVGISFIFRNQRKTEWEKFKKTTEEAQKTTTEAKPADEVIIITEKKDPETPSL
jgi:phage shock protein C